MPSNPHAPGTQKSTSFTYDQVRAMTQLFAVLRRGGDPTVLLRQPAVRETAAKFQRMLGRLEDERGATVGG